MWHSSTKPSIIFSAVADMLPSSSLSSSMTSYSSYVVQRLATSLIFDQSEAEKLSHTNSQTHKLRINILSGPALRAAPAKIRGRNEKSLKFWWCNLFSFQTFFLDPSKVCLVGVKHLSAGCLKGVVKVSMVCPNGAWCQDLSIQKRLFLSIKEYT